MFKLFNGFEGSELPSFIQRNRIEFLDKILDISKIKELSLFIPGFVMLLRHIQRFYFL